MCGARGAMEIAAHVDFAPKGDVQADIHFGREC
jgi:hypothetical protein